MFYVHLQNKKGKAAVKRDCLEKGVLEITEVLMFIVTSFAAKLAI